MEQMLAVFGGMFLVVVIVAIAMYVWGALVTQKVLRYLGYKNPWMAWIPYVSNYAIADVIRGEDNTTDAFGIKIPSMLFNFWWFIVAVIVNIPKVGNVAATIISVLCLAVCYTKIYARCEEKSESDTQLIGILSGIFPIIALIKFTGYHFSSETEYKSQHLEDVSPMQPDSNQEQE